MIQFLIENYNLFPGLTPWPSSQQVIARPSTGVPAPAGICGWDEKEMEGLGLVKLFFKNTSLQQLQHVHMHSSTGPSVPLRIWYKFIWLRTLTETIL